MWLDEDLHATHTLCSGVTPLPSHASQGQHCEQYPVVISPCTTMIIHLLASQTFHCWQHLLACKEVVAYNCHALQNLFPVSLASHELVRVPSSLCVSSVCIQVAKHPKHARQLQLMLAAVNTKNCCSSGISLNYAMMASSLTGSPLQGAALARSICHQSIEDSP